MYNNNFNRQQAVKYLKKGFTSIDVDQVGEEYELPTEALFFASIANSLIYLADSISELKEVFTEKGDDLNGRRETASSDSTRDN